ncbi:MAG: hypothetical protein ACYT04_69460 [Nostoc sp.]
MQPTQLHPIKDGDQGSRVGLWTLRVPISDSRKADSPNGERVRRFYVANASLPDATRSLSSVF